MLFRHSSLPISFALVVDDFAVKYKTPKPQNPKTPWCCV
jgi:hypothetical protein